MIETKPLILLFEKQFQIALQERDYYYHIEGTNAFRLFNAEGDGVGGLTIDNYDGHLLIQWYSKGIYKFRYNVIEAIQQVFPFKSIYEKCVLKTLNTPVDM